MRNARSFALVLAGLLVLTAPTTAELVVAPSALATTEGSTSYGFTGALTFQQLYGASQLAGLSPGDQITGIQFRLDGDRPTGPPNALTLLNFDVYLGPSNFPVGSLSDNVAANQGAGTLLTRSGALTIPPLSFPGGPGPTSFGLLIPFATPYTYTGDSLLVTLSYTDVQGGSLLFDAGFGLTDVQARQGSGYNNPRVDSNFLGAALVIQFTTTPVPEPSSLLLLGAGMGLIGFYRRRRAKRSAA